jgi:hypothetical protein
MTSDSLRQNRVTALAKDGATIPQIQGEIRDELRKVSSRLRHLRIWHGLTMACVLATAVGALLWLTGSHAAGGTGTVRGLILLTGLLAVLSAFQAWLFGPGEKEAVQAVENAYPELNTALLTALQLQPDHDNGRFGFLQSSVILQAFSHASLTDWSCVVSTGRMWRAIAGHFLSLALLGTTLWALGKSESASAASHVSEHRPANHGTAAGFTIDIEPGDAEVERGSSLLVLARITGSLPNEGTLVYSSPEAKGDETRIPLNRSLNDPVFGARIAQVQIPLEYHVELDGQISPSYAVKIFEYPRLERADAQVTYPEYTGLEPRRIQDVRSLSVVEGTRLQLELTLNQEVQTAELTEADYPAFPLIASSDDPVLYTTVIPTDRTRKLTLRLLDHKGRSNVQVAEIRVQVVPNQPATVKPVFPARDVEASPLEEIDLQATVWDDFGIPRAGVTYSIAGRPPLEAILAEKVARQTRHEIVHAIRLEDLKAQPDELVAYYFWAEDVGPDGQIRRTLGDMYFAEIRHFEEIFRQGEAQPGGGESMRPTPQEQGQGQSPNASAAQELADLQKQIINATWKVIRREIAENLSPAFSDDAKQLAESQQQALSQAQTLSDRVTDREARGHVERVTQAMQTALVHLEEAHSEQVRESLPQALIHEQAASQALLKLRAREHEITRQQQQQQPAQQASRGRSAQQRQQLDQLDLKEDDNRYETQRMAQSQQESTAERENRQVLNRLRELAQRQHDLNDSMKDLQSALEAASTEDKKQEIRRQLQRLQEEQEQILRDTDELQTRMDAPENQERMQDQRQQLEQAREQVQRAAESLRTEQATRAAAAGTRAEQSFEELREEFRRQSSGQFQDSVREIVEQARELQHREQEVRRQIEQAIAPDTDNRSLRNDTNREKIADEISQQRTRLNDLVERMQQTITAAEDSEPLLAEKLYDAAREVQSQSVPQTLDATRQSLQRGLLEDAQQLEQRAGRGLEQVREKIERAAESVLGDETEALRRAREELRNLSEAVDDELRRNQSGTEAATESVSREEPSQDPALEGARRGQSRTRDPGEQPEGNSASDESKPRQQRRGESTGDSPDGNPQSRDGNASRVRSRGGRERAGDGDANDQRTGPGINPRQPGQPGEDRGPTGRTDQPFQPGQRRQATESSEDESPALQEGQPDQAGASGGRGNRPGQRPRDPSLGEQTQATDSESSETNEAASNDPGDPNQQALRPRQSGQAQGGRNPNDRSLNRNSGGTRQVPQENAPTDQLADPGAFAPFTGRDFREWSDRLRDVEEMVSDPELRAEAARIRDRARSIRGDARRNSAEPNWDLVRMQVANPLAELSRRVNDELLRRQNRQNVVPLDRDQVPPRYSEKTRKYYERLGSGQ